MLERRAFDAVWQSQFRSERNVVIVNLGAAFESGFGARGFENDEVGTMTIQIGTKSACIAASAKSKL